MKKSTIISFLSFLALVPLQADSDILLEDSFERSELGEKWTIQNGTWKIADGILHITELPADQHAASGRRILETTDATFTLRFALSVGTKAFHLGFDPSRGELDKKGHLFSVIVMTDRWRIMKHLDKNNPKEDPNEVLAQAEHKFSPDQWYELEVKVEAESVVASIKEIGTLEGSHPSFAVKKPTIIMRVSGATTRVDDLKVAGEK